MDRSHSNWILQFSAQKYHICQLFSTLENWTVVIINNEIFVYVMLYETATFVI